MGDMIPLARPWIGDEEVAAVAAVLRSGMLVQGEAVERFEVELARRAGRRFGVAVSSGTAALELALEVAGIGAGHEVLVPALSWPSPAHAVLRRGATPVLVDVDPDDWNGSPEAFDRARTARTRGAIVIDQFGNPAHIEELHDALDGLLVIEDAACALGSRFTNDTPCGSYGLVSCMSFHPRKVITTGEGGACLLDDEHLAARLRALRNHGQSTPGQFLLPGPNLRLTELGGALGEHQLRRLDAMDLRRRHLARIIRDALADSGVRTQREVGRSNFQTLGVRLPSGMDRDAMIAACRARGVQAGLLSYAIHRLGTVAATRPLPTSEDLAAQGIALPLFPQMSDAQATRVGEVTLDALEALRG